MRNIRSFIITFSAVLILDALFDSGKWAIGRYTDISSGLSILMIVAFSAALASAVEAIHAVRRRRDKEHEQYLHHKARVWVFKGQKGSHWKSSLCPDCDHFSPDDFGHCLIESVVHTICRDNHLVLVVWECPKFKKENRE